jgi:hypothetical protein
MPQDQVKILPAWVMPGDLAEIIEEDGEWEDPSWDPLLLTVVGDTRHEGRLIKRAWQLSLWPGDAFFEPLNAALKARGEKADGHAWSDLIHEEIARRAPALLPKLHDDSDAATCVIWVETEADGRTLMETVWVYLHEGKAARKRDK